MLDKALEKTLHNAFKSARSKQYEFLTIEYLLYALLSNQSVIEVLSAHGADLNELKRELLDYVEKYVPKLVDQKADVQPTLAFQRVLQRAVFHAQSSSQTEISGANILISIFNEQDSYAVYLLSKQQIERLDIINYISRSNYQPEDDYLEYDYSSNETDESTVSSRVITTMVENLNEKALSGKIDPLIGRHNEIERTIQILSRRQKNNPLLVGEAGVGKTALVEGLALKIAEGDVPDLLKDAFIYSLDLSGLVAGTKYRGDFEKRFKLLLAYIKQQKQAILFVDEIHTLIGTGSASGSALDAANLLKPLLSSNEIRCIGSTTYKEFHNVFAKDHALARRFQKIDIEEPSVEESFKILQGLKSHYEKFHNIKYTTGALHTAVSLSARYMHERSLPDKAIDVIDEAGAWLRVRNVDNAKSSRVIRVQDIKNLVSKMARIPVSEISGDEADTLSKLELNLKMSVFGQDEAVETIVTAIKLSRSGLADPDKPTGCYLFSGPTGVGKTEIARQLAKLTGMRLLRFDMSEYIERHTISRLIGAPPGYVGFDQNGLLSDAVLKNPYSVVLLDEIEKAHPDIFNLLLQVMDYGKLTDASGRTVGFHNTILIMTTNAGALEMSKADIGFTKTDHTISDGMEAIKRLFNPEFRNRLDAIVSFKPLAKETIFLVLNKFIAQLQIQFEQKKVVLKISNRLREWLVERGFDDQLGARPTQRLINETLKKPLLDELLFGKLKNGGNVSCTLKNGKPVFTIKKTAKKHVEK